MHFGKSSLSIVFLLQISSIYSCEYSVILNCVKKYHKNTNYETLINNGIERFKSTPGFQSILDAMKKHLFQKDIFKGYIFEIETALTLNKGIIAFSQIKEIKKKKGAFKAEFDIITPSVWIECKSGEIKPIKLKEQLSKQQVVIQEFNKGSKQKISHLLVTRNSVSYDLLQWLKENNIKHKQIS